MPTLRQAVMNKENVTLTGSQGDPSKGIYGKESIGKGWIEKKPIQPKPVSNKPISLDEAFSQGAGEEHDYGDPKSYDRFVSFLNEEFGNPYFDPQSVANDRFEKEVPQLFDYVFGGQVAYDDDGIKSLSADARKHWQTVKAQYRKQLLDEEKGRQSQIKQARAYLLDKYNEGMERYKEKENAKGKLQDTIAVVNALEQGIAPSKEMMKMSPWLNRYYGTQTMPGEFPGVVNKKIGPLLSSSQKDAIKYGKKLMDEIRDQYDLGNMVNIAPVKIAGDEGTKEGPQKSTDTDSFMNSNDEERKKMLRNMTPEQATALAKSLSPEGRKILRAILKTGK